MFRTSLVHHQGRRFISYISQLVHADTSGCDVVIGRTSYNKIGRTSYNQMGELPITKWGELPITKWENFLQSNGENLL